LSIGALSDSGPVVPASIALPATPVWYLSPTERWPPAAGSHALAGWRFASQLRPASGRRYRGGRRSPFRVASGSIGGTDLSEGASRRRRSVCGRRRVESSGFESRTCTSECTVGASAAYLVVL
jgi:hypothetical protein